RRWLWWPATYRRGVRHTSIRTFRCTRTKSCAQHHFARPAATRAGLMVGRWMYPDSISPPCRSSDLCGALPYFRARVPAVFGCYAVIAIWRARASRLLTHDLPNADSFRVVTLPQSAASANSFNIPRPRVYDYVMVRGEAIAPTPLLRAPL